MPTMRAIAITAAFLLVHAAAAQSPHTHQHSFGDAEKWSHVFDDPERDAWQKPHAVLQALALRPDAVVAELGAGTGDVSARAATLPRHGALLGAPAGCRGRGPRRGPGLLLRAARQHVPEGARLRGRPRA